MCTELHRAEAAALLTFQDVSNPPKLSGIKCS